MNGYQTPGQVIAEAGGIERFIDGMPLRRTGMDLKAFSKMRIGKVWTAEDHDFLADQLRQIDELAAALARVNQGGQAV